MFIYSEMIIVITAKNLPKAVKGSLCLIEETNPKFT